MIIVNNATVFPWVEGFFRTNVPPGSAGFGITHDGALVGAVVYSNLRWRDGALFDVEITMALTRPASFTKGVRYVILAYPFSQLGAEHVSARVDVDNERSIKLTRGMGLTCEGRVRGGTLPDQWLFGMTRGEYERSVLQS